jgi:hypothetical protein
VNKTDRLRPDDIETVFRLSQQPDRKAEEHDLNSIVLYTKGGTIKPKTPAKSPIFNRQKRMTLSSLSVRPEPARPTWRWRFQLRICAIIKWIASSSAVLLWKPAKIWDFCPEIFAKKSIHICGLSMMPCTKWFLCQFETFCGNSGDRNSSRLPICAPHPAQTDK